MKWLSNYRFYRSRPRFRHVARQRHSLDQPARVNLHSRWRPRRGQVGVWVALLSVGLTGCVGPDEGQTSSPTPPRELIIVTPTPGSPRTVAPTPVRGDRYLVQKGDTLSGIAASYGVMEIEIQAANDLDDPNRLTPGQELIIPSPEP